MTILANVNVGTTPNDGTGDSLRDSFITINENFQQITEIYPNVDVARITANITSTGTSTFNAVSTNTITAANIQSAEFGNAGAAFRSNTTTTQYLTVGTSTTVQNTLLLGGTSIYSSVTANVVTVTATTYDITNTDYFIIGNLSAQTGGITLYLPYANVSTGRMLTIRKIDPDNASSGNVTLEATAGGDILVNEHQSFSSINVGQTYSNYSDTLISNGTYWILLN